jgi:hypothetical protein
MIQIGICVFICTIKRKYELLSELLSVNQIHARDNRRGDIINVHSPPPKPSRPITIVNVHVVVPKWNKSSGAKGNHVHIAVFSIILGNQFGQNLAAPVPRIRLINTGCGNEYNLVDAEGSGRFKHLEGAAHVQVKEIVRIFPITNFVDTVPGGYVDDTIAATKYFCQLRPV